MPHLTPLALLSKDVSRLQKAKKDMLNSPLQMAERAERVAKLAHDIEKKEAEKILVLQELVLFPPHHGQYAQQVEQFCKETPSDKSVFIMTKYPDGKDAGKDQQLVRVIKSVKDAVAECKFAPRVAGEKKYHGNVWENVEIYMLACARGIAIVEGKFKPELNPNVAMEWGWMGSTRKPVLYLVEKDVDITPADVGGLIKDKFQWDNPEPGVRNAVFQELTGAPPP